MSYGRDNLQSHFEADFNLVIDILVNSSIVISLYLLIRIYNVGILLALSCQLFYGDEDVAQIEVTKVVNSWNVEYRSMLLLLKF